MVTFGEQRGCQAAVKEVAKKIRTETKECQRRLVSKIQSNKDVKEETCVHC